MPAAFYPERNDMTVPLKVQLTGTELNAVLTTGGPHYLAADVYCRLPGVEPHYRHFACDPTQIEESSAFYDDVNNEIRTWARLLLEVVHSCALDQGRLFD